MEGITCASCYTQLEFVKAETLTMEDKTSLSYEVWKCNTCGKQTIKFNTL